MNVSFIDIRAQYEELKSAMDAVVLEVISGGAYVMGKHHNALEQEIAALHGCEHGIAVNSGTDALRIMLDAAGVGSGDEVITTAFTFVATAEGNHRAAPAGAARCAPRRHGRTGAPPCRCGSCHAIGRAGVR